MNINAGETKYVQTQKYGNVKLWNWNDEILYVTWYNGGKHERRGWLKPATGESNDVPSVVLQEVVAALG